VAVTVVLFGGGVYCVRKNKRTRQEHFFELTEQNQQTQRLLDSANNPLEQTQFLIDPSELHLGKIMHFKLMGAFLLPFFCVDLLFTVCSHKYLI